MKNIVASLFILFFCCSLQAQNIGEWQAYPSIRSINDLNVDSDGVIWGATNGGVFINDGKEFKSLSTIDGLSSQQVLEMVYDSDSDKIYVGYSDGLIDVINTETLEIHSINDIARASNYTSRRINDFTIHNGKLFTATDFGIVVINLENEYVEESFIQLGNINRASPVLTIAISGDVIVAGTQNGLAIGELSDELAIQDNWISFDENNGFQTKPVLAVAYWNDSIFASTADANYVYDGANWDNNTMFNNNVINSYKLVEDNIHTAISNRFLYTSANGIDYQEKAIGNARGTEISPQTDGDYIYFGSLNEGLGKYHMQDKWVAFDIPDGPYQNNFQAMLITESGTFLSASTNSASTDIIDENSRGYYIYDDEWQNYNQHTSPELKAANFKQTLTTTSTQEYFYIGSWGQGVARHDKESDEIYIFDQTNSTLRGWVDDNPNYPVISGLATDRNDDVWLVSRFGSTPLYYQKTGDEDWINFSKHSAAGNTQYFKLFIDSNNRKWISLQNTSAAGEGLLVMDTGNPEDSSDDKAVRLTTGDNSGNLPDAQIKSIIEDLNGEIWIGTQRGIARFLFPEFIIEGSANERNAQWLINEDTSATSRFLLRDANVSSMAVNSANEKWIGTENQGIFVVNAEGSQIINRLTKQNSPLYSNQIIDIEISEHTGEVFISTDMGLISYMDIPRQAKQEMETLKVYPNPFNYNHHTQIIVDGLSESTIIKVLGVDGNVVQELTARGGRTSWNGLDYSGNRVGSGVYFIVAHEEDGKNRGMGKVVIIR